MKRDVYLSLGSNLGEREKNITTAKNMLGSQLGGIVSESSVYETSPWGFQTENEFYNCVVHIKTDFNAREILNTIEKIEKNLGRTNKSVNGKYISRLVDIDILFYGKEILDEPDLIIPHKNMKDRLFELIPMQEINGNFLHPVHKQSITELVRKCKDMGKIKKIS